MRRCPHSGTFPRTLALGSLAGSLVVAALAGCGPSSVRTANRTAPSNHVVLYCSVDDVYAKPLIAALEKRIGLQIDVLYDTEAT